MTKLERLVSAVRKAFENPNLIPTRSLYVYDLSNGTVECCGLGACYVAAVPDRRDRIGVATLDWVQKQFGIDHREIHAFTAGFDNSPNVRQDITAEEREYYTAGLNLGREYVDRVA